MAKLTWGIKHAAITTICKGAILPLLTYGALVWVEAMNYEHNRKKYIRVQRLINIRMAKAYRTTSSKALCMMTGMTPIILKLQEVVRRNTINRGWGNCKIDLDHDVEFKYWPQPAEVVTIKEVVGYDETSVQAYTDGSKHNNGVGSGAAIFIGGVMEAQIKIQLDNRCSNNQAEQLAILKTLEAINLLNKHIINPWTATIVGFLSIRFGIRTITHILLKKSGRW
jgi:hypothetical protein